MEELENKIKQFDLLKKVKKIKKQYTPLIGKILNRDFYHPEHERQYYPTWDIKVYRTDESGHSGDNKTDRKWDILWEKWLEKHDNFFWDCCEDGLGFVGDKTTRHYDWHCGIPEIENCDYELWQAGRSGGHLYLKSFDGWKTNKDKFEEIAGYLDETIDIETDYSDVEDWISWADNNMPDRGWLKRLIMFCESLDAFDATKEWNYQCNYRRSEKEAEWEAGDFSDFNEYELQEILNQESDNTNNKTVIQAINKYFRKEGERLIKKGEKVYA